jgi:hypothetical protein
MRAELGVLTGKSPGHRRFAEPFTRRLLFLLSYTGGSVRMPASRGRPSPQRCPTPTSRAYKIVCGRVCPPRAPGADFRTNDDNPLVIQVHPCEF